MRLGLDVQAPVGSGKESKRTRSLQSTGRGGMKPRPHFRRTPQNPQARGTRNGDSTILRAAADHSDAMVPAGRARAIALQIGGRAFTDSSPNSDAATPL